MNKKFELTAEFIRNTFKRPEGFIGLHEPVFTGNERKYTIDAIDSTFVSSVGKYVDRFEEAIAEFTGAKRAIACVNGTNALHLALLISGVKQGDEVLTQDLTFIATTNAIRYCNADPVFLDIDPDNLGLSAVSLRNWLEKNAEIRTLDSIKECYNTHTNARISACVPMHTFGHPCDMDEIMAVCSEYSIKVIEDAAESLGSYYKNKHTGTLGHIGVISFNGNKIITTGGGGVLLFNDDELAARAKHLSTQAKVPHKWEFVHDEIGYNYRMPNINAALGLAQLEQINDFLARKRSLAIQYKYFFKSIDIKFVEEPEYAKSNYWLNAVVFKNIEERDAFLEFSNASKIMTRPSWELMHRLKMYENSQHGDLSNAIYIADRLVNIPSSVIF